MVIEVVSRRQIWIHDLKGSFLSVRSEALSVRALVFTQHWAGLDVGSLSGAHLKANTGPEDGHSDGVLWATETFYLGQYAGVPLPQIKDYTPLKSGFRAKSLYKLFSSDPAINIALRESAPNAMLDLNCPEQWLSPTWSRFSWLNSCPESDKFMIWELLRFSAWITQ